MAAFTTGNEAVLEKLKADFGDSILNSAEPHDFLTIEVKKEKLTALVDFLFRDESLKYQFLTSIIGIHYPEQELPIGVIYQLRNLYNNQQIRIKVFLPEHAPRVQTLTGIFPGANWMERETYDYYGVIFEGHPDLRRILNVDDMVAFPMRKDFPLEDPNRIDKNDEYFGR